MEELKSQITLDFNDASSVRAALQSIKTGAGKSLHVAKIDAKIILKLFFPNIYNKFSNILVFLEILRFFF